MNTLPVHDPATGDLRGYVETAATPGDITVGDLPNSDTPTDDMRGQVPLPETDPETNKTRMIVGVVAVAALIGGIGIYAFTTGMWNSAPVTPHVVALNSAPPALPAAAPQQDVVPAPLQVKPSVAVEQPPVPAPVATRSAAPSHRSAVRALPERIVAPPATTSPEITPVAPLTTAPLETAPISPAQPVIEPTPPVQSIPDQPAPSPQTTPSQPPQ